MWTADEIAQLCYEHYGVRLPKQGKPEPNREWTLLAAIVKIQSSADQACDTPGKPAQVTKEVVSMGTGTKCIGQSKMRKSGDILNDSHAEVIAKRSFQSSRWQPQWKRGVSLSQERREDCGNSDQTSLLCFSPAIRPVVMHPLFQCLSLKNSLVVLSAEIGPTTHH